MHPWLIEQWGVTTYGTCIVLALILAWIWTRRRARRAALDPSHIDLLLPVILAAGLLGAWLFGRWTDALTDDQVHGAVLVGSLLCSTAAGIAYALLARIPLGTLGDLCAPPLALGLGIGRIGCFCAGCCFGKISDSAAFLPVRFPRGSFAFLAQIQLGRLAPNAPASLPVYPVQLYEAAACALLALIVATRPTTPGTPPGERFLAVGIVYAFARFFLEFLRGDNPAVLHLGHFALTFSQCAAIAIFLLSVATWIIRRHWAERLSLRIIEPAGSNPISPTPPPLNAPASLRQ